MAAESVLEDIVLLFHAAPGLCWQHNSLQDMRAQQDGGPSLKQKTTAFFAKWSGVSG